VDHGGQPREVVVADQRAGAVELEHQRHRTRLLRILDRAADEVGHDRIDQTTDLGHEHSATVGLLSRRRARRTLLGFGAGGRYQGTDRDGQRHEGRADDR
jgi:hypothetical protein